MRAIEAICPPWQYFLSVGPPPEWKEIVKIAFERQEPSSLTFRNTLVICLMVMKREKSNRNERTI